jgi:hypothetical protein
MMKKLLILMLVLGFTAVSFGTTVYIVAPEEGAPGSASNPLDASEYLTVYLRGMDGDMDSLVCNMTVAGNAVITDAVKKADQGGGTAYRYGGYELMMPGSGFWQQGWQSDLSFNPVIAGDGKTAAIGLSQFGGRAWSTHANGTSPMGYFVIHCEGEGEVVLTISEGEAGLATYGSSQIYPNPPGGTPSYGGSITVYQIPEPMTVMLLGLGGLFLLRRRK